MKKLVILAVTALIVFFFGSLHAQNVTITDDSTHNAHGSSMLDVYSLSKGFLMPRLTTTQRTGIAYPATGLIVFDTDSSNFFFYNGAAWVNLLTLANIAAISDTIWKEDVASKYVRLNNSINRVGVGVNNPDGKMEVWGDSIHNATDTIPLFAVKDKDGNDVFVVYPRGVMVYVDTITDTSGYKDNVTTSVTGFRVGKKTGAGSKGFDDGEYFTISPAGNVDTLGSQARILWYPLKEAFLSGRVIVESPDSVGYNSWASGYLSKSIGDYSQALGYRPKAVGNYSTAIGNYALALGDNSFALGDSTIAGGGGGNKAASNNCYAFGKGSEATGDGSYAFGKDALSTGIGSFALGDLAQANGTGSYVLGENSYASNTNSYAFGKFSQAIGSSSFAFGDSVVAGTATKKNAYVFGKSSSATGNNSFVFGFKSMSTSTGSIAMGIEDTSTNTCTIAIGGACHASDDFAFAAGFNCKAHGEASIAFGNTSNALSDYSIAIGSECNAVGEASVALGSNNNSLQDYSFTAGRNSVADGQYAIALGDSCKSIDSYSISMGFNCKALNEGSIAIGYECKSYKLGSISIGGLSQAKENSSIVIGSAAVSYSAFETVIGLNNTSYSPAAPTGWSGNDRLFVIGNGWGSPSNALTVLKNGNTGIGTSTPNNLLNVVRNCNGSTEAQIEISPAGGGTSSTSLKSKIRFRGTFDNYSSDQGPRVSAQISSGFSGGVWGFEYLAFGVGSAGDVANDPSEKMRILSNGYVGIGTTSPNAALHVNGPSGVVAARIQVNGQSKFTVASNGGVSIGAFQDTPPSNGLYVSGSVGIGTSSPAYQLDVNGWIRSSHVRLGGNTDGGAWSLGVSGQSMLRGVVWMPDVYSHPISGSYTYLRINSDGDLGTLSSSKRYKENITDMENIAWLYDLRPVNYNYINDSSKTKRYGLIAEEVEKVNNHFVAYFNNGAIYTVNYDDLITPMLKAIQELNQKISEQQQTIIELQHQVSESKADNELLKNMSLQMEELNKKYDALMAKQGVSSNK